MKALVFAYLKKAQEERNNVKALLGKNLLGKILAQERRNILDKLTQGQDSDQENEDPDEDTPPPLEGDDVEQPDDQEHRGD